MNRSPKIDLIPRPRPLNGVVALAVLALAGCAPTLPPAYPDLTKHASPERRSGLPEWDRTSYWDGGGATGEPRIEISLGQQRAEFYRGDQIVGVSVASTGREGFNTPPGKFRITEKSPDHRSNLYGSYVDDQGNVVAADVDVRKDKKPSGTSFLGAPMPNFLRFNRGIGMHAGFLPGYAASHGCVRLPPKMAQHFYDNVGVGTTVVVK
ncbi:hypothetical protein BH23VER1_BH23VER1_16480 [soil metagenome]